MQLKIVFATLAAAVAFFPLATTPGHAATCAEELTTVQDQFANQSETDALDKRGAEYSIADAKKALSAGDEAKCQTNVKEAERQLQDRRFIDRPGARGGR
jgi:hypothetical protein